MSGGDVEVCGECRCIHGPGNTNTLCPKASNYKGLGHTVAKLEYVNPRYYAEAMQQLTQARAELERANAKLEAVARDNLELTSGSLGIDPDVYRLAQEVVKSHNVRLAWEREARELLNELSNYADATGAEVCIRVDEFLKSGLPEKL